MHAVSSYNIVQTLCCMSGGASVWDSHHTLSSCAGSLATRIPPGQIPYLGYARAVGSFRVSCPTLGYVSYMDVGLSTPLGSDQLAMATCVHAPCACRVTPAIPGLTSPGPLS